MSRTTLHPDSLESMRRSMALSLDDVAEIYAQVAATDGQGGTTLTWQPVTLAARSQPSVDTDVPAKTTMPARLAGTGAGDVDRIRGEGQQTRVPWVITFEYGTVVLDTDRVKIGGRTFEVQYDRSTGRTNQISARVFALEVGLDV